MLAHKSLLASTVKLTDQELVQGCQLVWRTVVVHLIQNCSPCSCVIGEHCPVHVDIWPMSLRQHLQHACP